MRVEIPLKSNTKSIYIQGLRDYPDPACRPHTDSNGRMAVLEMDLNDVYRCAVTRVINKQTVSLVAAYAVDLGCSLLNLLMRYPNPN